jgi:hypothetical protein
MMRGLQTLPSKAYYQECGDVKSSQQTCVIFEMLQSS